MTLTGNQITQGARIGSLEIEIITANLRKIGVDTNWQIVNPALEEAKQTFPGGVSSRNGNFSDEELDDVWDIYKKHHNILAETLGIDRINCDMSYKDELAMIILKGISRLESYDKRYFQEKTKK